MIDLETVEREIDKALAEMQAEFEHGFNIDELLARGLLRLSAEAVKVLATRGMAATIAARSRHECTCGKCLDGPREPAGGS